MRLPRVLVTVLAVLISAVWTANVVLGFLDPARHDPTINAVFAVVVGSIFTLGGHKAIRWRVDIRNDDDESTSEHRR